MKLERFQPSARLRPFVKALMIVESETEAESRILPDTSLMLAFRIRGKVSQANENAKEILPPVAISGLRGELRVLNYEKRTATLVVAFREGGARAFFREPLHRLFGVSLPLDDLVERRKLAETEEKLSEAADNRARIRTVEDFLLAELRENQTDWLVAKAVSQIKNSGGDVRIKELLKFLHTSRDPFEKRFRQAIGTSPKQFSQIIRLRGVVANYAREKNLTALANDAGYFDQAHFIREIRAFTGLSPRRFFSSNFW